MTINRYDILIHSGIIRTFREIKKKTDNKKPEWEAAIVDEWFVCSIKGDLASRIVFCMGVLDDGKVKVILIISRSHAIPRTGRIDDKPGKNEEIVSRKRNKITRSWNSSIIHVDIVTTRFSLSQNNSVEHEVWTIFSKLSPKTFQEVNSSGI